MARTLNPTITFINQHYYPDVAATGQILTDLCEYLAAYDFNVRVICSRGHYLSGQIKAPAYEVRRGVEIHRIRATSHGRESTLGRMTDYASFFFHASRKLLELPDHDAIVTLTTPPMLGNLGSYFARLHQCEHIIWSMDLHPDAEIRMGFFPEQGLGKWLWDINRQAYANAAHVVDLGPRMHDLLSNEYQLPEDQHSTIRVWSHAEEYPPIAKEEAQKLLPSSFRDRFIVQYSGNLGLVHEFETMIEVIDQLKEDDSIGFVFNGDGPKRAMIEQAIVDRGLTNVCLLPYVDRDELYISMAKADVHWLSLEPKYSGIAVPAKLTGYMASRRPVLFVGDLESDSARDIREAECGYTFEPGSTESIIEHIRSLQHNESLRRELGMNGRYYFEAHSERLVCCEQWELLLKGLLS
jgi:glycosyltransferase involved in cell wall biosynthesis